MDPDQFREIRLKINRLNEDISMSAENKNEVVAIEKLAQATALIEKLVAEADGKIQTRSVKNLENKLKFASTLVEKIKISKTASKRPVPLEKIIWDEERLSHLSNTFLTKLLDNMRTNTNSQVCFSTIGKGIKPSYQIDFGNGEIFAFSGSNHKKLKKNLPKNSERISPPFSFLKIKDISDNAH